MLFFLVSDRKFSQFPCPHASLQSRQGWARKPNTSTTMDNLYQPNMSTNTPTEASGTNTVLSGNRIPANKDLCSHPLRYSNSQPVYWFPFPCFPEPTDSMYQTINNVKKPQNSGIVS